MTRDEAVARVRAFINVRAENGRELREGMAALDIVLSTPPAIPETARAVLEQCERWDRSDPVIDVEDLQTHTDEGAKVMLLTREWIAAGRPGLPASEGKREEADGARGSAGACDCDAFPEWSQHPDWPTHQSSCPESYGTDDEGGVCRCSGGPKWLGTCATSRGLPDQQSESIHFVAEGGAPSSSTGITEERFDALVEAVERLAELERMPMPSVEHRDAREAIRFALHRAATRSRRAKEGK